MELEKEYTWTVEKNVKETPHSASLYLSMSAERPTFIAGQYLTIKLPGYVPVEGKAYSISSAPDVPYVRITIKKIGQFSAALLALQPGAHVVTSAPYGFFYPEQHDTSELIFVVGGIGITPCLSIITHLVQSGSTRRIVVHYSNQTEAEIAFHTELTQLANKYSSLKVHHYITREVPSMTAARAGRMTAEQILSDSTDPALAEYFICGSIDFTRTLWKQLYAAGLAQHQLYTEGFF